MAESQPIDFACETIEVEDLIRCSFQLKSSDYTVIRKLMDNGEMDIDSIADSTGLERSTVQKSLQRLIDRDLARKRQVNITSGGYKYIYSSVDKENIKERVTKLMEDWINGAKSTLMEW
ncbi:MAG: helix-turn-helix domain-containing protein [Candidatus Aenigmatarchaeota archaeon]